MPGPISKVSVALNGGVDELGASELSAPIAQQGASLTLRRSENTRLSPLLGTCTHPPSLSATPTDESPPRSGEVLALVPSEAGRNVLQLGVDGAFILGPNGGDAEPGSGPVVSGLGVESFSGVTAAPARGYLPTQILASGPVPGEPGLRRPMFAYAPETGYLYYAYVVYDAESTFYYLVAGVLSSEGGEIATPRRVALISVEPTFFAITGHGTHGIRVWLGETSGSIAAYELIYSSDNALVANSAGGVIPGGTNPGSGRQFSVCSGLVVEADGTADESFSQYAFITTQGTPDTDILVSRVDVNSYAVTSATIVGGGDSTAADAHKAAVCFGRAGANYRVGYVAHGATDVYLGTIDPSSMVATGDSTPLAVDSRCACQIVESAEYPGGLLVALVSSSSLTDPVPLTYIFSVAVDDTTSTAHDPLPWMSVYSLGSSYRFDLTTTLPVFELVRHYEGTYALPPSPSYVSDPDLQLWLFRSGDEHTTIARVGCLRPGSGPARVQVWNSTASFWSVGSPPFTGEGIVTTYQKDLIELQPVRSSSRWVQVGVTDEQPSLAFERSGLTLTASALPMEWDGVLLTEAGGPLYKPYLNITANGSATNTWAAGDYLIGVHYSWTDAAGLSHRSAVTAGTFTSSGTDGPIIRVSVPTATTRNGAQDVDVTPELYVSDLTDPTLRKVNATLARYDEYWEAVELPDPAGPPARGAVIYSTGDSAEEQMPQPPPPLFDVSMIGDRAVGIDAEFRSRLVFSKRRSAGRAPEWHPVYELNLPAGAGRAMAVREWQGGWFVLAELACFVVSGDGPDNLVGNPSGGGFSKPQKIADIGTTDRRSVLVTPVGILFRKDEEIYLFAGGTPAPLGGVVAGAVTGAFLLRDEDEAVFVQENGRHLVFNYALKRWTTWDYNRPARVLCPLPYAPTRVLSADENNQLYLLDSTLTAARPMLWETDWLVLGGDFQDHVNVQHVVFSARSEGLHGVQIDIFTDYNDTTPSTSRSWPATGSTDSIAALAALGNNRYTLKVQPTNRGTRAVKIRLTETSPAASAMVPVALTLYYSLEANLMEPAIRPGAFK